MKLRSTLAGTAVLVTLLGAGMLAPGPMISSAQAQAAISINVFYNDLAQHGDWVSYEDRYVFVPTGIEAGWRPYTRGHWVDAERVGWTWVSDEPFGWATYHYGRWGYADEIGWYWVPGTVWAPAWVSWKRTPEHVVWAPLPVTRDYDYDDADIRIDVSIRDIPDVYWVVVPAPQFLEINLNVVVINDRDRRERIIREAEFVGPVRIENNIVVNNVIDVDFIEETTGRDVRSVEIRETNDPREAKQSDDGVVVVKERIDRARDAKPGKVTKLEEVKRDQENRAKSVEADGEQPGSGAVDEGDVEQGDAATDQGATAQEGKTSAEDAADAQDQAEEGEANDRQQGQKTKRKKQKAEQQKPEGTQGVIDEQDQPAAGQAETKGQKAKRKKQKANQQPEGTQGVVDQKDQVQGQGDGERQGQKAKRKEQPRAEQPEGTQGVIDQGDQDQPQGQKVRRKKAQKQGASTSTSPVGGSQSPGQGGETGQASGGQSATEEVQP